ncbi:MAG: hypothetical protein HYZ28_06415 [Myxococcales bacterium]|nr:hypothetical protein [Myxococcales bacterium]
MSYYDLSNRDLKYAHRSNGVWSIETVDGFGEVGQGTSLALDPAGHPHVSAQEPGGALRYLERNGGTWRMLELEGLREAAFSVALALRDRHQPLLCYSDLAEHALRCARP